MEERNIIIVLFGNYLLKSDMKCVKVYLETNKYATVIMAHDKNYYGAITKEDEEKCEKGLIRNYKTLIDVADHVIFFSHEAIQFEHQDELIKYALLNNKIVLSNTPLNGIFITDSKKVNDCTYDGLVTHSMYEVHPYKSCNIFIQYESDIEFEILAKIKENIKQQYPGIFTREIGFGNNSYDIPPLSDITVIYNNNVTVRNKFIDNYLDRLTATGTKEREVYFLNRYGLPCYHIPPIKIFGKLFYKYNYWR